MKEWMEKYTREVRNAFGERIWFLGLQGSRGRGEATPDSDIDVVLILNELTAADLTTYRCLLNKLPMRDKICGFVSGRAEIEAWEKSELFQFCRDTTPIIGSLESLLKTVTQGDLRRAICMGACNVYHGCVHNLCHARSTEVLEVLYKSAAFTLQAIAYLQTGKYARRQSELPPLLSGEDQVILETCLRLKQQGVSESEFETLSQNLLQWSARWITVMQA